MKPKAIARAALLGAFVVLAAMISGCGDGSSGPYPVASDGQGGQQAMVHAEASQDFGQALCSRCHTAEGARAYIGVVNGTETPAEIYAAMAGKADIENPSDVSCNTCHDQENSMRLLGEDAVGLPASWSLQFRTCTACHQLLRADGTVNQAFHGSWGPVWGAERIITDSHNNEPGDYSGPRSTNIKDVAGYNLDSTDSGVCGGYCHDVHSKDLSINRQWAATGHADRTAAGAWAHYNWSLSTRADCQRCHTETGFEALAAASAAGAPYTPPLVDDTYFKPELLVCPSCHMDNSGGLRQAGILSNSLDGIYTAPAGRVSAVPELGGSNLCMVCHIGRESGVSVKNLTAPLTNTTFVNSHYLAAGGVLFRTLGYEYTMYGLGYDDPSYFKHDLIGVDAVNAPGTGSEGPCVGCHMRTGESHLLSPVRKENGYIVEITADALSCSNCHSGSHALTASELNEAVEGFEDALHALESALGAQGFVYVGSHPYFNNKDWTIAHSSTDPTGKNNMGAAFNFALLHHEPGAYAHNRYYTKRLIYDSIDWIDNGVINGVIDLTGYDGAYLWMYNGTDPITSVTRP